MAIKFDVQANNKDFLARMREVQQSVHNTKESIEKDGASMDVVFQKLAQGAAALGVSTGLYEFAKQTAVVRGEFQKLEVAFTTLLKSKAEADDLMKQLVRTAATTPFDLKGVADGAKQLMAYGLEADKVNDKIVQLGNLASGLGLDIGYITTLYGTTVSKDHMDTMDLKQFKGQGIAIDQAIADVLAVDVEKVKSMISSGQITGEIVDEAIAKMTTGTGQFAGLMEAQSKTIAGIRSNIEDAVDTMFNDIGKASEGVITDAMQGALYLVEHWREVAEAIGAAASAYGAYKAAIMTQDAITNVTAAMQYQEESEALIKLTEELEAYKTVKDEVEQTESYESALDATKMSDDQKEAILELREAYMEKARAVKESADQTVDGLTKELSKNEEAIKVAQEKVNVAEQFAQAASMTMDSEMEETAMVELNTAQVELNAAMTAKENTQKELVVATAKQKAASEALDTAATATNTIATQANVTVLGFLRGALTQATAALKALWATMMANPLAIVAAGVVALGYGIYELITYESDAEKASRELKEASADLDATMSSEQVTIDRLFAKLENAKEGTEEYKKAKDDILASYGKYLNGLDSEIAKLNDVAGAYRAISAAARQAARDRAIADQTAKATDKFNTDLAEHGGTLQTSLEKVLGDTKRANQLYERYLNALDSGDKAQIESTKKAIQNAYKAAKGAKKNSDTLAKQMDSMAKDYTTLNQTVEDVTKTLGVSKTMDYVSMSDDELNKALSRAKQAHKNISKTGKKQVVQVAEGWYDAATEEEASYLVNALSNELAKRKKKAGSTTAEKLDDYKTRIGKANTDEARDSLIKELKDERKKAEDGSSFKDEVDKLLTQVEKSQAANAHKSSKDAGKEAAKRLKAISDYKAAMEKLAYAKERLNEDIEAQMDSATIDAMEDGFAKEQKLRERQHKYRLTTILRNAEDQKRALIDQAEQEYEKNPDNKGKQFDRAAYINTDEYKNGAAKFDKLSNAQIAAENKRYNTELRTTLEEASEIYKGYYTNRLRTAEKFNKDIAKMREAGASDADIAEAQKQRDKALEQIDINEATQMDGFEQWVDSLTLKTSIQLTEMLTLAELQLKGLEASSEAYGVNADQLSGAIARARAEVATLSNTLKDRKRKNPTNPDKDVTAATNSKKLQDSSTRWQNLQGIINECTSAVSKMGNEIGGTMGEISSIIGDMGNNTVSFMNAWQEFKKAQENVEQLAQGAQKMAMASSGIGMAMVALQVAMEAITKLVKMHDDNLQKKIEAIDKQIKALERTYDELGEKADKAYGKESSNAIEQQNALIQQQIALVEKQKKLEDDKKKTDKDKIESYDDKIYDLRKKYKENQIAAQDAIFGNDIQSAIDDFTSSISDAWASGESRAKSARQAILGELKNMVYAAMKADIAKPMEAIRNKMLDYWSDNVFTDEEIESLKQQSDQLVGMIDEKYAWADSLLGNKDDSFNGTSGGFQSMSQESADELNGRFAQSQQTLQGIYVSMTQNIQYLTNISAMATANNSVLNEMLDLDAVRNTYLQDIVTINRRMSSSLQNEISSIRQLITQKL